MIEQQSDAYVKICQDYIRRKQVDERKETSKHIFTSQDDPIFNNNDFVLKRVYNNKPDRKLDDIVEYHMAQKFKENPSPFIVKIYGAFELRNPLTDKIIHTYIVMKKYQKDLQKYLEENRQQLSCYRENINIGHGIYIFLCILFGLTDLKEVYHRDLKPKNVFVDDSNGKLEIVLGDLGDVTLGKPINKTIIYSEKYLAPEMEQIIKANSKQKQQYEDEETVRMKLRIDKKPKFYNRKIDGWNLGNIAFQIFCSYNPFKSQQNEELPLPFNESLRMRKGDKQRYYEHDIKDPWLFLPTCMPPYLRESIRGLLVIDPAERKTLKDIYRIFTACFKEWQEDIARWNVKHKDLWITFFEHDKTEQQTQNRVEYSNSKFLEVRELVLNFHEQMKERYEDERSNEVMYFIYFGERWLRELLDKLEQKIGLHDPYDYIEIRRDMKESVKVVQLLVRRKLACTYRRAQIDTNYNDQQFKRFILRQAGKRLPQSKECLKTYEKYLLLH